MQIYNFCTDWFFQAPIEQVWEQITDMKSYPTKWPTWKQVIFRNGESEVQPGSVIDYVARGPLPFTVRFTFEITAWEPPILMEYKSSGDLVGECSWVLEPHEDGTMVTSCWDMGTTIPICSSLPRFRFIDAIMYKHHDYVMAQGYRGFRATLEADVDGNRRG
jgi:uncharacterized protein YndB with AHSA1/START domain